MSTVEEHYLHKLSSLSSEDTYEWICDEIEGLAEQLSAESAEVFAQHIEDGKRAVRDILAGKHETAWKAERIREEVKKVRLYVFAFNHL